MWQDFWDDIGRITKYAEKRYSKPLLKWKRERFELRCHEIFACETALNFCMNEPFIDPRDILERYQLYLIGCATFFKNNLKRKKEYETQESAIENLLRFLK